MKRYDSYKDSGVKWIGEIPSHWKEYRLKYLLSRSAAGVWGDDEKEDENDIVCFRIADFDYGHGFLKFDNITYRNIQKGQLEGRLLSMGDLLIEKSGGGDTSPVGRVVRFNYDGIATCSNFIHSISVKETSSSNFLYYFFYSLYANKENLLYFNQTTGIQNLKVGEYLSQSIFLPELGAQKAIAEWLDVKCGEIDKLIATQQRRIELLQELRQSIITRAVTRGINPDAPLRDSGIDWIGQIPSHWEISKMNYVCDVITDYVASGSFADLKVNVTYLDEPDYAMLVRTADLSQKNKDVAKVYVSKQSYDFLSNSNLFGGEIILPNIGASIGDVYMVPIDLYDKMTLAPNSIMVKTKWCDLFYFYYFKSVCGRKSLELIGQAAAQGKFNKTELRQLRLPLPPLSEQREIVAYIEKETTKVDHALQQAERQIELLQELRQSVITEVVTGKRKVC